MMTARFGCLSITLLFLLAGSVSAQQAPKGGTPPPAGGPASFAAPAIGKQPPQQTTIPLPQPEVLLLLVRSALIALDHANRTGNYTVLRELGGPGLQAYSTAQLANIFADLRNQQVDLLLAAILTPQLTQQPSVSPEGLLQLVGFFPTLPRSIEFHIVYQPVSGQWKLFGLTVRLVAPAAPQASTPPSAQPAEAKADAAKAPASPPAAAQPAPAAKKK
jgi:hypothetical protein